MVTNRSGVFCIYNSCGDVEVCWRTAERRRNTPRHSQGNVVLDYGKGNSGSVTQIYSNYNKPQTDKPDLSDMSHILFSKLEKAKDTRPCAYVGFRVRCHRSAACEEHFLLSYGS